MTVSLALAALVAGCDDDDNSERGLAVIVETDLSLPKDLDKLTFEVRQDGETPRVDDYPLGKDQLLIPAEFRVRTMGPTAVPVLIRAVGWKGGSKRVERSVITTIPTEYLAVVRLPLSYLCVGKAREDGSSTCGDGQTCKLGSCEPAQLDPTTLPAYEKGPWTGSETSSRDPSLHDCFDVVTCFAQGSRVNLDRDACTFTLDSEDTSNISVGIKLPRGSDGICGAAWCWIALDEGAEGWTEQAGLFTLPRAMCVDAADGTRLTVIATNTCATKTPQTPSCDEGSAATHPSDTSETIGVATGSVMETPGDPTGPSCGGSSFQECGNCGQQRRTCRNGNWGDWAECLGEGVCVPNSSESCGESGMRICSNTCEWGNCTGDSCPGSAVEACGNCGTRRRACTNGEWSAWGECEAQGDCEANTTRTCAAGGTQACLGNCQWGTCGANECPGAPQQACGNCGTQSRQCNTTTMAWSEFGACGQEGACEANQTRVCGSQGVQTCGGNCQWDAACAGQRCEGPASMPCGLCGIQTRTCDSTTGAWSGFSACRNEGVCAPGSGEGCGAGGTRLCLSSCQWSEECSGQSCVGSMTQSCGFCGSESRICDPTSGAWLPASFCANQGACNPGSTRRCGANNTGTLVCTPECQWDLECAGQACPGASTVPCGNCGIETRTCDGATGEWQAGVCRNESVACTRGAETSCGTHKVQRCSDACQPGACVCDAVTTLVNGACVCSATGPRDNCCPPGVSEKDDPDCPATCRNGAIESGEICDSPDRICARCNDGNACTRDLIGDDCKTCVNPTIESSLTVSDNVCCPAGSTSRVDVDCPAPPAPACDDGTLDDGEMCDRSNATCPVCSDGDPCTTDATGSNCRSCSNTSIAGRADGMCCPAGATSNVDPDCPAPTDTPACNDGTLDEGEMCDRSNATCAACSDGNPCTTDETSTNCKQCSNVTIQPDRDNKDGACCPAGANSNVDADCPAPPPEPACNDGQLDPGEMCDRSNATCAACNDRDSCTTDTTAGDCKECSNVAIQPDRDNEDGVCCPAGANSNVDADCPAPPPEPACNDGKLDDGEKCDASNAACADCNDADPCTRDTTDTDCRQCRNATIQPSRTTSDDLCCPAGSTSNVDIDCPPPPAACDDGKLDPGEQCDESNAECGRCADSSSCTRDMTGSDCKVCRNVTIQASRISDGICCPVGSTSDVDADCPDPEPPAPVCGNGRVESGEQCEPPDTDTCNDNCRTITPPEPPEPDPPAPDPEPEPEPPPTDPSE